MPTSEPASPEPDSPDSRFPLVPESRAGDDEPADGQPAAAYLIDRLDTATNTAGAGSFGLKGTPYDQSVQTLCLGGSFRTVQVWPTAGFSRFQATVGIADDQRGAVGLSVTVRLQDENGHDLKRPFPVSLGKPHEVDISIKGVTQMQVTCLTRDGEDNDTSTKVVLGDAALS